MLTVLPIPSRSEIRSFLSYSFLIKVASLGKGGHLFCEERKNGGIAQLVEHLPCKQGVIGSNPITSTIMGSQLSWLEHTPDKREVDGPSPFEPTKPSLLGKQGLKCAQNLSDDKETEDLQLHSKQKSIIGNNKTSTKGKEKFSYQLIKLIWLIKAKDVKSNFKALENANKLVEQK